MVCNLKATQGLLYLKILIFKIKIAKELLILGIEEGLDVSIPKDLS
jgi:hypothetical protein